MSQDPCSSASAICRHDVVRGRICALPGQTDVVCGISSPPQQSNPIKLNELIDAIKVALSLAGMGNISTSVDLGEKSIAISADVAEGNRVSAIDRAKEAIAGLSIVGLKGAGGLLSLFSEPVIIDGELMMTVRFPILFLSPKKVEKTL